jgi:prepilin-type N-terminal cleavage/methylation domain-containing protein
MRSPVTCVAARPPACRARGFTLIELVTVMAVIGILVAILVPVVGSALTSAKRAKTRVQFSQWATAIEGFRQEYGYWPAFSNFAENTDGAIDGPADTEEFVQTLSGHQVDGSAMVPGSPPDDLGITAGNTKRIRFCAFAEDDLTESATPLLQDAFGNTDIVVLMDKDFDGMVKVGGGDYADLPPAVGSAGRPGDLDTDGESVRASVIFYSAGDGTTPVTSW